jgi:hypothetical protein
VSLRAADIRFLLPSPPQTAALISPEPAMSDGLTRAGIRLVDPSDGTVPDLVIAPRSAALKAGHAGARSMVVDGRPVNARAWSRRGRYVDRYLVKSGPAGPILVALATAPVRGYLATTFSRPSAPVGRMRNRVLNSPLGNFTSNLVVASLEPGLPYPIAAALPEGVGATVSGWLLSFRQGDDLQRVIALVFCNGTSTPSFVVKFGRVPGAPARAAVEKHVLEELCRAAPELTEHATTIEHRGLLGGSELTVEPAAAGSVLTAYLQQAPIERSMAVAENVLDWVGSLGRHTARPNDAATTAARDALLSACGAERLAERLAGLPAVVAHQDLGSWNILTDGTQFTVVDWESATTTGLPLTDLFYFCTDVLAELHAPRDPRERPAWCADLWAGSLPASAVLKQWVLRAARAADVPEGQIGALATACWLHHGQSHGKRAALLDGSAAFGYLGKVAPVWRTDPRLGLDWEGFSAWPST